MSTQVEAELAIERLLDHLQHWLVTQPEWPVLMGASDRGTRKRVARLIAEELTTIPTQQFAKPVANRKLRRAMMKELAAAEKEWFAGLDL